MVLLSRQGRRWKPCDFVEVSSERRQRLSIWHHKGPLRRQLLHHGALPSLSSSTVSALLSSCLKMSVRMGSAAKQGRCLMLHFKHPLGLRASHDMYGHGLVVPTAALHNIYLWRGASEGGEHALLMLEQICVEPVP